MATPIDRTLGIVGVAAALPGLVQVRKKSQSGLEISANIAILPSTDITSIQC